jgi:hypothetical protein
MARSLQSVQQGGDRTGGEVELLTQTSGSDRLAAEFGVHHRDQGLQIGGVEAVQVGEGVPDVLRVDGVPPQVVGDFRGQLLASRLAPPVHLVGCHVPSLLPPGPAVAA